MAIVASRRSEPVGRGRLPVSAWPTAVPLLAGAVLSAVFLARTAFDVSGRTWFSLFDDAMVSMTYARNLADGEGLVWNPGGDAVEGYSNFLWTLWMAVPHALGVGESKVSLFVMLCGAAILIANLLVVRAIALRILHPEARLALFAALLLTALFYPLVYWTLRGMEVGLVTLLVSGMVLQGLRLREAPTGRRLAGLAALMCLAALTRDDLVAPALVIGAFAVWTSRRRAHTAAVLGASLAATIGAHELFRVAYYGEALPNTYYLKLGDAGLVVRLKRGVLALATTAGLQLYLPCLLAGAALVTARRHRDPAVLLLVAVIACLAAYSVYVGGDAWEQFHIANRYVVPAAPLLFVLAAAGADSLARGPARRGLAVAAVGIVALVAVLALEWPIRSAYYIVQLPEDDALGEFRAALAAGAAVAVFAVLWTRRRGAAVVAVLAAAALVTSTAPQFSDWVAHNGQDVDSDAYMTRYGLFLREVTDPQMTIAVGWAGALRYFSHRPGVDLLGKSDATIARLPLNDQFKPGHNKWDYEYSIARLRPAIVSQVVFPYGPEVQGVLDREGYVRLPTETAPPAPEGLFQEFRCCGWARPDAYPRLAARILRAP